MDSKRLELSVKEKKNGLYLSQLNYIVRLKKYLTRIVTIYFILKTAGS